MRSTAFLFFSFTSSTSLSSFLRVDKYGPTELLILGLASSVHDEFESGRGSALSALGGE
jgi:hypothetical protein